MRKSIILLIMCALGSPISIAQKLTGYTYRLDNGINVKMEQCWNQVWVTQSFEALNAADKNQPFSVNVRTLGNLTSGSTFRLSTAGKEIKLQDIKPGTYDLRQTFKLSGKPGTIICEIAGINIKPQSKTVLSIILYDYQITIDEKAESHSGSAAYTSKVERYKGNTETNPACGVLTFYEKGKHTTPVVPTQGAKPAKTGDIKPGTYDVLLTLGAAGRPQRIWFENFTFKPDVSYGITVNLNAGLIEYLGTNREVKAIHLYPAGTADRQKGSATPDKSLEIMRCEAQATSSACPPGTYDVLLNIGDGKRYEWRKGIPVTTGTRAQVK